MSRPGTVLVTGGSAGLGAATVEAVAAAGGTPLVVDVTPPAADVDHQIADVSDREALGAAVDHLIRRAGRLDGLVTAAGIDRCGELCDVPAAEWERVIAVNLLGTASAVRVALPELMRRQGRIVTIASTLGLRALPDATAYCASKFGVVGFTRALAAELAERVGVTLLIPGGMHTGFFDDRAEQYRPGPDAKLNRPEDTAAAILAALCQPPGCELRELVVAASGESSWP